MITYAKMDTKDSTGPGDLGPPPPYSSIESDEKIPASLPSWRCYWSCEVWDWSGTEYILWYRKVDQRSVHGYSFSKDATGPEYYVACRNMSLETTRRADDQIRSTLRSFLNHRASAHCECSLRDLIADQAWEKASLYMKELFVIGQGSAIDGIKHFSQEPPRSASAEHLCKQRFLGSFRYSQRAFSVFFSVERYHDYYGCLGSYMEIPKPQS